MKKSKPLETADLYIDEETKDLLKTRDPEFLKSLFSEVNPYLIRVCLANGILNEHANDVIYDTWERFFTNLDKFEGRSQIRTFICGILFNKIREHRRAQNKTIFEDDSENVLGHAFTIDGWWNVEPHSPQKLLELKQSSNFVQDCLEGLNEQQKTAFVLREVDEEDSDNICNILGVNVTHLRVLLFRAKDKLRKCLEGKVSVENA